MTAHLAPGQAAVLDVHGRGRWPATVHAVGAERVAVAVHVGLPGDPSGLVGVAVRMAIVTPRGLVRAGGAILAADPTGMVELSVDEGAELDQRREHVRVAALLPGVLTRPDGAAKPLYTYTLDVSGGGLLVAGAGLAQDGDVLQVAVKLPDRPAIEVPGVVARRSPEGHAALVFADIEDAEREQLVRFVFERQRLDRRAARQEGG